MWFRCLHHTLIHFFWFAITKTIILNCLLLSMPCIFRGFLIPMRKWTWLQRRYRTMNWTTSTEKTTAKALHINELAFNFRKKTIFDRLSFFAFCFYYLNWKPLNSVKGSALHQHIDWIFMSTVNWWTQNKGVFCFVFLRSSSYSSTYAHLI